MRVPQKSITNEPILSYNQNPVLNFGFVSYIFSGVFQHNFFDLNDTFAQGFLKERHNSPVKLFDPRLSVMLTSCFEMHNFVQCEKTRILTSMNLLFGKVQVDNFHPDCARNSHAEK